MAPFIEVFSGSGVEDCFFRIAAFVNIHCFVGATGHNNSSI
jgi:hypothetical protein